MSNRRHNIALRTVATIEATKGVVVLALAIGLIFLVHKDLAVIADRIVELLHLNPYGRVSDFFYNAADRATTKGIWTLAAGAFAYSVVRFVEAYGLWHDLDWAEWFALLSGCLYLPWEIYRLFRRSDLLNWGILIINIAIVLYMAKLRLHIGWREDFEDG